MNDFERLEASIQQVYDSNAQAFDRQRNKSLFEKKWLDIFCSHLKSGDSILDVGCGSGTPIAEYFIQKQYKVTGVDFSPNMLKMTSERFPQQEWILQDMREIHLNRQFDGIISWNGFFHLNHKDQYDVFSKF